MTEVRARSGQATSTDVRVPKASDVLAKSLRDLILSGATKPGTSLASERELVTRSGLSRVSVREALRILELEGLVRTRPGRNGGTFVSRPDADTMTRTIDVFIRGGLTSLQSLIEIRAAIEPPAAGLAATRATREEVEELLRLDAQQRERLSDPSSYREGAVNWHLAIARASHNEFMAAFVASIAAGAFSPPNVPTEKQRQEGVVAHERIVAAIQSRDAESAIRRMRRHVAAWGDAPARPQPADATR
jgi:GntR family transcriptional regulator, transcriptional repressor for pyruvate dehydrogenase complex